MDEERGFLAAILERPDDDATKLVYADWLDEQGDPRGEYLRLMVKVRQARVVTPEQRRRHKELSDELAELHGQDVEAWRIGGATSTGGRERQRRVQELSTELADLSGQIRQRVPARLQELAATLDPNWLAVVSDPEIEGCGRSSRGGWLFRFDFVCDRSWADMRATADDKVRHCETCRKNVYFCDTLADAREHSSEGHCIAVDLGIIRRDGDSTPPLLFAGQPSKEDLRQTYEEDVDPVSRTRLEARSRDVAGNPGGLRSLARYSRLPTERIRYVPDADEATVRSISRGVLFLMAFWSGPAARAFAKLTEVLARLDAEGLELVVADVDGSPDLYELPEFKGKVHGAGETAWVRDGRIVSTSGLGLNTDCFEPNTMALLSLP